MAAPNKLDHIKGPFVIWLLKLGSSYSCDFFWEKIAWFKVQYCIKPTIPQREYTSYTAL